MFPSNLISAFNDSSIPKFKKELGKTLMNIKSEIKNFDKFFSKKQYRKVVPDATDESRYRDMIDCIFDTVKEKDQLYKYLIDTSYYDDVSNFIKEKYTFFEDDFKKSYKSLGTKFNRLFNPKKEEDSFTELYDFDNKIKKYSLDFNVKDYYLYYDTCQDYEKTAMENYPIFSLVSENGESLWVSEKEIDMKSITEEEFFELLHSKEFEMNPLHFVCLDTLKRDLMKPDFDKFKNHLKIMPMRFYCCDYLRNDDFNQIDEGKINNAMNGFAKSIEDYAKYSFAKLDFNGKIGDVSMKIYWCSTKDIKEIMSQDDYEIFKFEEIDQNTFIDKFKEKGQIDSIYLH